MTNFEKLIQDMTPERMAGLLLAEWSWNGCDRCSKKHSECDSQCHEGVLEWLEQEAEYAER